MYYIDSSLGIRKDSGFDLYRDFSVGHYEKTDTIIIFLLFWEITSRCTWTQLLMYMYVFLLRSCVLAEVAPTLQLLN